MEATKSATSSLRHDHQILRRLFSAVAKSKTNEEREDHYVELRLQLEVHAAVEAEAMLPLIKFLPKTAALSLKADIEWHNLRERFAELDEVDIGASNWMGLFLEMEKNVLEHFRSEEEELFPVIEDTLSEMETASLNRDVEECRQKYI